MNGSYALEKGHCLGHALYVLPSYVGLYNFNSLIDIIKSSSPSNGSSTSS